MCYVFVFPYFAKYLFTCLAFCPFYLFVVRLFLLFCPCFQARMRISLSFLCSYRLYFKRFVHCRTFFSEYLLSSDYNVRYTYLNRRNNFLISNNFFTSVMSSPNKPDTTLNRARYVRFRKEEEQTRSSEKTKHENKGPFLNKGRVKQINMNRSLEKQVRELQDGLKKEVRRREAIKSSLGNTYVGKGVYYQVLYLHML